MLILSRKVNEEIIIDGNIRVKPVKLGRGRVRLGISAPPWIDIHRSEHLTTDFADRVETPKFKTTKIVAR